MTLPTHLESITSSGMVTKFPLYHVCPLASSAFPFRIPSMPRTRVAIQAKLSLNPPQAQKFAAPFTSPPSATAPVELAVHDQWPRPYVQKLSMRSVSSCGACTDLMLNLWTRARPLVVDGQ